MLRALFTQGPILSLLRIPFVFISSEPAVICCDKAASTGGARVSRVEGHTASVLLTFEDSLASRKGPRRLWYICNHVTRYVPFRYNCSPVTNCLPTFFFTLWPRARTYNTSRRNERVAEFLRVLPPSLRVFGKSEKSAARRGEKSLGNRSYYYFIKGTIRDDRSWFLRIHPFLLKIKFKRTKQMEIR